MRNKKRKSKPEHIPLVLDIALIILSLPPITVGLGC
jgi:hypothetical protein